MKRTDLLHGTAKPVLTVYKSHYHM